MQSGVVFLSDVKPWGDAFLKRTFAHELVHMNQLDQIFLTLNEPYDDWLRLDAASRARTADAEDVMGG